MSKPIKFSNRIPEKQDYLNQKIHRQLQRDIKHTESYWYYSVYPTTLQLGCVNESTLPSVMGNEFTDITPQDTKRPKTYPGSPARSLCIDFETFKMEGLPNYGQGAQAEERVKRGKKHLHIASPEYFAQIEEEVPEKFKLYFHNVMQMKTPFNHMYHDAAKDFAHPSIGEIDACTRPVKQVPGWKKIIIKMFTFLN